MARTRNNRNRQLTRKERIDKMRKDERNEEEFRRETSPQGKKGSRKRKRKQTVNDFLLEAYEDDLFIEDYDCWVDGEDF